MNDFSIPAGKNTPLVQLQSGSLSLKGKSFPENARKFYDDLAIRFKTYPFGTNFSTEIDLDYMSSSSVICILDLLKRLKGEAPKTDFSVTFIYDAGDEDMQAVGENYSKILDGHFTLVPR